MSEYSHKVHLLIQFIDNLFLGKIALIGGGPFPTVTEDALRVFRYFMRLNRETCLEIWRTYTEASKECIKLLKKACYKNSTKCLEGKDQGTFLDRGKWGESELLYEKNMTNILILLPLKDGEEFDGFFMLMMISIEEIVIEMCTEFEGYFRNRYNAVFEKCRKKYLEFCEFSQKKETDS